MSRDESPRSHPGRAPGQRPEGPAPRDRQLAGPAGRPAVGGLRDLAGGPAGALGPPGDARPRSPRVWAAPRRSAPGRGRGSSSGVVLAHLAFWLDHVDGQVARWRGTASLDGVYLDYLMHHAREPGPRLRPRLRPGRAVGRPPLGGRPGSRSRRAGPSSACTTTAATRRSSSGSRARRELSRRGRQRRAARSARPLAPAWPRDAHLARVQGLRAARRPDRPDGPGRARDLSARLWLPAGGLASSAWRSSPPSSGRPASPGPSPGDRWRTSSTAGSGRSKVRSHHLRRWM